MEALIIVENPGRRISDAKKSLKLEIAADKVVEYYLDDISICFYLAAALWNNRTIGVRTDTISAAAVCGGAVHSVWADL